MPVIDSTTLLKVTDRIAVQYSLWVEATEGTESTQTQWVGNLQNGEPETEQNLLEAVWDMVGGLNPDEPLVELTEGRALLTALNDHLVGFGYSGLNDYLTQASVKVDTSFAAFYQKVTGDSIDGDNTEDRNPTL